MVLTLALTALIWLLVLVSLLTGYVDIGPWDVVRGALGLADEGTNTIVQELRLPRTLLALLIGAALGASGAVLQGLLLNPLAEPGVIGISSSASLGAVIVLYFGLTTLSPLALPIAGMLGAAAATALLYVLAARNASTLTLILAGVAIGGLAIALTSLAMNLSPNPWAVAEIVFWLLGSLRDRTFAEVTLAGPFIVAGLTLLLTAGRALEALTLGEDAARSLGVSLVGTRLRAIVGTSLAVGASVSVAGAVGFVGLVVPHLLRPLVGYAPSRLILPSALGGAALLLAADTLVRLIAVGPELQLGVVTSLIGAPFFFYLILQMRGRLP